MATAEGYLDKDPFMLFNTKSAKKEVKEKTTEVHQKEVVLLVEPTASFVSLVKHGANGESFFIVKSKKDKDDKAVEKVIQRIILSKDLEDGDEEKVLRKMKTDQKSEYDTFNAYDQVAKEDCEPGSFETVQIDKKGKVFAVLANLTEEATVKAEKEGPAVEIAAVEKVLVPWEVEDKILDEIWALERIMYGILSQESSEFAWQKSTLKEAVKNFASFMEVYLDSIDGETIKEAFVGKSPREKGLLTIPEEMSDKLVELTGMLTKLTEAKQITKEEKNMDQLFETKEQVKEFIIACINDVVSQKAKTAQSVQAAEAAAAEKKTMQETLESVAETMKALKADVDTLKGKTPERLADKTGDEESPVKKSGTDDDAKNTAEENVFKGLFFDTDAVDKLNEARL